MGRIIVWIDLPLSITKTNPFCQPMCDVIAIVVPSYRAPTFEDLQGAILQAEKSDINNRLEELKKSWESIGCTVMFNGWTDTKGRTLINFFAHLP